VEIPWVAGFEAYLQTLINAGNEGSPCTSVREDYRAAQTRKSPAILTEGRSQVWVAGSIAYRCRDCGTTDDSAVCVACFRDGGHEVYARSSPRCDWAIQNSPEPGLVLTSVGWSVG
jgi:hypothetical protein